MSDLEGSLVNRPRAIELMERYGIDAMVAATPENVAYLSDYSPWFHWAYRGTTTKKGRYESYALMARDEGVAPALMIERLDVFQSQWPSWMEDLYTWGSNPLSDDVELDPDVANAPEVTRLQQFVAEATRTDSPADALVTALRDRGLDEGVVALDTEGVPPHTRERLRAECPDATFLNAGEFFRFVRAVKSPREIELLRRAAEINEQAVNAVLDAIEVGVTEEELARLHRTTVTELGAIPDFFNLNSGKRAGTFFQPSDRALEAGDLVWMDGGCIYERYHSDTGTCAVVGADPTEEMTRWYEIAGAGMEAALDVVRDGVTCSEVTTAMHDAIREAGASEAFGFGHAIGIEARDMPLIQPPYGEFDDEILEGSTDITLQTDMVINIEVPHWEWNMGGVQREHSVVVQPDGYELLTEQNRTLNVV